MTGKRTLIALTLVFASLFVTYAEARAIEIRLKRVPPEEKAIGYLTIRQEPFVPLHRELRITLHRLRPNSTYSVWLVDPYSGERTPAGLTGQNHFKTDGSGGASYAIVTDELTLGWKELQVSFHPDGNPANTKDMVLVLKARLYQ